jgi:hypothetical protein
MVENRWTLWYWTKYTGSGYMILSVRITGPSQKNGNDPNPLRARSARQKING